MSNGVEKMDESCSGCSGLKGKLIGKTKTRWRRTERLPMRSRILERTGVMEIGLKSAGEVGVGTFGIGRTEADFH